MGGGGWKKKKKKRKKSKKGVQLRCKVGEERGERKERGEGIREGSLEILNTTLIKIVL